VGQGVPRPSGQLGRRGDEGEFQPATWQAFWGLTVEGKSGAEVAAELGLSVDAVYAAKSRVLRRLRQELDGLLE
jgi:RNA polymerase sigma-70 factor (ECF subfamily)